MESVNKFSNVNNDYLRINQNNKRSSITKNFSENFYQKGICDELNEIHIKNNLKANNLNNLNNLNSKSLNDFRLLKKEDKIIEKNHQNEIINNNYNINDRYCNRKLSKNSSNDKQKKSDFKSKPISCHILQNDKSIFLVKNNMHDNSVCLKNEMYKSRKSLFENKSINKDFENEKDDKSKSNDLDLSRDVKSSKYINCSSIIMEKKFYQYKKNNYIHKNSIETNNPLNNISKFNYLNKESLNCELSNANTNKIKDNKSLIPNNVCCQNNNNREMLQSKTKKKIQTLVLGKSKSPLYVNSSTKRILSMKAKENKKSLSGSQLSNPFDKINSSNLNKENCYIINSGETESESSDNCDYEKSIKKLNKKLKSVNKFFENNNPEILDEEEKISNYEMEIYDEKEDKRIKNMFNLKMSLKAKILNLKRKKIFGQKFNRKNNIESLKDLEINLNVLKNRDLNFDIPNRNNISTGINNTTNNNYQNFASSKNNFSKSMSNFNTSFRNNINNNNSHIKSTVEKYKIMKEFSSSLKIEKLSKINENSFSHKKPDEEKKTTFDRRNENDFKKPSYSNEEICNYEYVNKVYENNENEKNRKRIRNDYKNIKYNTNLFNRKSIDQSIEKRRLNDFIRTRNNSYFFRNSVNGKYLNTKNELPLKIPIIIESDISKNIALITNNKFENPEENIDVNIKEKETKEIEEKNNVENIVENNEITDRKKSLFFVHDSKDMLDINKINDIIANSEKNNLNYLNFPNGQIKEFEKEENKNIISKNSLDINNKFKEDVLRLTNYRKNSYNIDHIKNFNINDDNKNFNEEKKRMSIYFNKTSNDAFRNLIINEKNKTLSSSLKIENQTIYPNKGYYNQKNTNETITKRKYFPTTNISYNAKSTFSDNSNKNYNSKISDDKITINDLNSIIDPKSEYTSYQPIAKIEGSIKDVSSNLNSTTNKNYEISNKILLGNSILNLNKFEKTINNFSEFNISSNYNRNDIIKNNNVFTIDLHSRFSQELKDNFNSTNNMFSNEVIPENNEIFLSENPENKLFNRYSNKELLSIEKGKNIQIFSGSKSKKKEFNNITEKEVYDNTNLTENNTSKENLGIQANIVLSQEKEKKVKIDIPSKVLKKRIIKSFSSVDNKCEVIGKALNLEKLIFNQNKTKERMIRKYNEDLDLNNIIISNIKKDKKQKFFFKHNSSISKNDIISFSIGKSFLDVIEYTDKISQINSNTIFKFSKIINNKVPKFIEEENNRIKLIEKKHRKSIEKIESNNRSLRNLRQLIDLKRKKIMN